MRKVHFKWTDIAGHDGDAWQELATMKPAPFECEAVGFVVYEDAKYVVIAQDVSDEYCSGITTYPRGCIGEITLL